LRVPLVAHPVAEVVGLLAVIDALVEAVLLALLQLVNLEVETLAAHVHALALGVQRLADVCGRGHALQQSETLLQTNFVLDLAEA